MNSKVHPLVVVLVTLLAVFAIGVWTWGTGEAKAIGGPAGLRTDPDGHLYIQIQNQLLEHDAAGVFVERHDLAELGVEHLLGDVAFFSNGDVFLRRGPDPRSLSDNLRAYQRRTNDQSLVPETPDAGLYRCALVTADCVRFGLEGVDFKAAHSVYIDWRKDEVYISDTTRHRLRKYSADGSMLAPPVDGFRFPNQLLMHDGRLLVADTNHHRIRIVDPNTEAFGEELAVADVVPDVALVARQTWPSRVAGIGDEWWVNNMRAGMNEGGVYVFDENWRYDRKIALPPGADPMFLLPFRGEMLISDWNNDRVYRVSADGELLADFVSPGLEEVLAESRAARRQFEVYGYSGIALFVLVLLGLFARGLAVSMATESA